MERGSGLRTGVDFRLGSSPERIKPGDTEHTREKTVKVVASDDDASLERFAALYERIITAGVHRAASIEVAEAAKAIENTQRDLIIALMNELAIIFERLGLRNSKVPGLVAELRGVGDEVDVADPVACAEAGRHE